MDALKIAIPHGGRRVFAGLNQSVCLSKTSSTNVVCTGMTPVKGLVYTPSSTVAALLSPTEDHTLSEEDTIYHGDPSPLSPIPDHISVASDHEELEEEEKHICSNEDVFSPKSSKQDTARISPDPIPILNPMKMPDITFFSPSSTQGTPLHTLQLHRGAAARPPAANTDSTGPMRIVVTPYTPDSHHQVSIVSDCEDEEDSGFVIMHSDDDESQILDPVDGSTEFVAEVVSPVNHEELSEFEEDEESYSDGSTEYESSSLPMDMLLGLSTQCDEDIVFAENGYRRVDKICDTLQGELYKAEIFKETTHNEHIGLGKFVAIKKIDKSLRKENIAERDGVVCCVQENVEKEAKILEHLTVDNTPTGKDVARFVEFFETEDHLYLVTEFVDGCTLSEFVERSFDLMDDQRLDCGLYRECIRFIMWQMVTTISWLHRVFNCCHMDLCLENVMIHNVRWQETKTGQMKIRPDLIKVKVVDFGVAEIFETPRNAAPGQFKFQCDKEGLNIEHEAKQAPESAMGSYDARALDMWSLGMIFYESMVGEPLYEPEDKFMWDNEKEKNGYYAVKHRKLREYMAGNELLANFKTADFKLLEGLLEVKAQKRLTAKEAEKHAWFQKFYRNKFYDQKHNTWLDQKNRASFPYYSL